MHNKHQKEQIYTYWNQASCGTEYINEPKYSRAYYEAIEQHRYATEPEIFSFAQFSRFYGKKVLEVGVGAGTDFIQWMRSGAIAHGIDITPEAIYHSKKRLLQSGFKTDTLLVADVQKLPYRDLSFDLVYSWGVIHHTIDMEQSLKEIIRVTKSGGSIKLMVYNRYSLFAFYQYVRHGLCKGKPWLSLKQILFYHQESIGTQAYTRNEIVRMMISHQVIIKKIDAPATAHDLLFYKSRLVQRCALLVASLCGYNRIGWFMMIELEKK